MKPVLFLDLDDTLFQTARKCPPGVALLPGAANRAGQVNSWLTPQQAALWQGIAASGIEVVPVTARSAAGLGRVLLPLQYRYACVDFGATLLVNVEPDAAWQARAVAISQTAQPLLQPLWDAAQQHGSLSLEWVVSSAGPLYLTARDHGQQPGAMQALREAWSVAAVSPRGHGPLLKVPVAVGVAHGRDAPAQSFFLHDNHTLALIPSAFDKHHAVAEVQRRLREEGPILSLGLADSTSDAGFLRLCDFIGLPAASQLARKL